MSFLSRIKSIAKSILRAQNDDSINFPLRYEGAEKFPMGLTNRERYFRSCRRCNAWERENQIRCSAKCQGKLLSDPGFLGWRSGVQEGDEEEDDQDECEDQEIWI